MSRDSSRTTISSIGEFNLIRRLSPSRKTSKTTVLGIGDDAAALRLPHGHLQLVTTDALIESVHFDRRWDSPIDIGWKAMAANLSDIAAMNGSPVAAVMSIALPKSCSLEWIESVYKGARSCADQYGVEIVGGDTVRSPGPVMLTLAVIGHVVKRRMTLRSGAKRGDLIYITGTLGSCAATLRMLQQKTARRSTQASLSQKHHRPIPRLDLVECLKQSRVIPTAMIDISDGLISDLSHIAQASRVRCAIDPRALPASPALLSFARISRIPIRRFQLNSGEEYELAMTVSPRHRKAMDRIPDVTCIGVVQSGSGVVDTSFPRPRTLAPQGFQHF